MQSNLLPGFASEQARIISRGLKPHIDKNFRIVLEVGVGDVQKDVQHIPVNADGNITAQQFDLLPFLSRNQFPNTRIVVHDSLL